MCLGEPNVNRAVKLFLHGEAHLTSKRQRTSLGLTEFLTFNALTVRQACSEPMRCNAPFLLKNTIANYSHRNHPGGDVLCGQYKAWQ